MDGLGTYLWQDGRMYYGDYVSDKKHGHGVYQWADGRAYVGNWENGKQSDVGVYILPNGTCKKGKWENGTKSNMEKLNDLDSQIYKNELEKAKEEAAKVDDKIRKEKSNLEALKNN